MTDAICYHDGHRALASVRESDFREVPIFGDDGRLRDEQIIRIADIGFPESVLLDTDAWLCHLLRQPEFQRRMTGCEFRYLPRPPLRRGRARRRRARRGCSRSAGARRSRSSSARPADGSVFLNSMKLWALREAAGDPYAFELDLNGEVFESCAYHHWGLFESEAKNLGTLILGGGVPKNFNLQPEPALSQILGFEDVRGFLYDIQITTAPVTDGSLSSCPPAEAVTWGKVDKDHYRQTTESFSCDYSVVMPILAKALLDKRGRLAKLREELGEDALLARHPEAKGYLRDPAGYRLYDRRDELIATLLARVRAEADRIRG